MRIRSCSPGRPSRRRSSWYDRLIAGPPSPDRRFGALTQLATSTALHLTLVVIAAYTSEALRKMIQGTVVLEVVVTGDGCASQIRIVRSLDRGGLDEEAVAAVAQWRFEPGRLAGAPVDVLVTIMVDFSVR